MKINWNFQRGGGIHTTPQRGLELPRDGGEGGGGLRKAPKIKEMY